jgi:hypothetical protein
MVEDLVRRLGPLTPFAVALVMSISPGEVASVQNLNPSLDIDVPCVAKHDIYSWAHFDPTGTFINGRMTLDTAWLAATNLDTGERIVLGSLDSSKVVVPIKAHAYLSEKTPYLFQVVRSRYDHDEVEAEAFDWTEACSD